MKFVIITLFLIFFTAVSQNPGIKLTVTPDAVKSFQTALLPQLIAKIGNINVQEIHSGDLTISNLVISQLNLPADSIRFSFNDGHLSVATDSFGLNINMHAKYHVLFFDVSFDMSASCSGSSLGTDFGFGYASEHVILNMNSFSLQIRNLNLHFPSGIADAVVSAITSLFRGPIQDLLSNKLSDALKAVVQDSINKVIAAIPGFGPIPGTSIGVNYNTNQPPRITGSYFSIGLNGTFYDADKGFNVPPVPLPDTIPEFDQPTGGSAQVFISQYMANTALYTLWQSDLLKVRVTNSMIPAEAPIKLNIQWLQVFIPSITQYYDPSVEVVLNVVVAQPPSATITLNDIEALLNATVVISAVQGQNITEIVSLEGVLDAHANVSVANWKVKPFVASGVFSNLTIIHSNVGPVDPAVFQQGLNLLAALTLPAINAMGLEISLPSVPHVDLRTLSVGILPGYLEITAIPSFSALSLEKINFGEITDYKYNFEDIEVDFLGLIDSLDQDD